MMRLWRWLKRTRGEVGTVRPWNAVIAEQHAAATERLLLGSCGTPRRAGDHRNRAIAAGRERWVAERHASEASDPTELRG